MTEPLSFTGERFLPEREGEIWYEHWHRYALARQLSQHRSVLDVACGEGYGSAMLAENAERVTGVDISVDAIRHARSRYGHQANLEFIAASCDRLPFPDASFDLAISFETIEHIETQQAFVAELARVLRPDGVLLLSSPNKRLYSDAHDYHNEFHVRELYRDELEELLRAAFPHRFWLGQKLLFHSAIWPESGDIAATEYLVGDGGQVVAGRSPDVEPMYYMVACSRNPSMLPAALGRLSLFSDAAETVYRDYVRQTRRVLELDRLLIDRERLVAERDDWLALRTAQMEERDALLITRAEQIAERDVLLTLRTGQMEERERMIVERDTLLAQRDALLAQRAEQIAALNLELDYRASLAWWLKSPWRIAKRIISKNP
ncbi:MAG: methyltransferase domain-containing protein [Gallionella sp.]|nr:methyltransferase domain-containing protein [Gallionella sp.]